MLRASTLQILKSSAANQSISIYRQKKTGTLITHTHTHSHTHTLTHTKFINYKKSEHYVYFWIQG